MSSETEISAENTEKNASDPAQLSAQLAASEHRYRTLFLQEQRRARHLSLINEVQKCALATREIGPFLPQVTRAISSHFPDCDVAFYMSRALTLGLWQSAGDDELAAGTPRSWPISERDGADDDYQMVVVASYGKYGLCPPVGRPLSLDDIGEDGEISAPDARSFLTVPISLEGENIGLISVQSPEPDVLDARDVAALHTAGAIIAAHIQNSRLFRHMNEVNAFNQSLLDSMLHSMMVVDDKGLIQFVNERLLGIAGKSRAELRRQPLETIFGETPAYHHNLRGAIGQVLETGKGQELPEVHIWTPNGPQIFDLRLFRVFFRGQAETAILLINLTERWRKTYQLQLTHEIGRLFQESLDIERVLSTILTCITAGSALGFNRAFVFLLNESGTHLEGRMALGPSSPEEAGHIWGEISQRELTLEEILQASETPTEPLTPLQEHTARLSVRLDNPCFPSLRRVLETKTATKMTHSELILPACQKSDADHLNRRDCDEARGVAALLSAYDIAVAPLIAKDRFIGVVFADNLYSNGAIEHGDIQLLDTLAQQAALTIDNALTYQALQGAQRELVSAERLVAVGEMAARVSHEIRNPLATIGGFGHSILKKPDDESGVTRKARVIVSEVARLEELLTDLLDMARARPLKRAPESINEIAEHALLLAEADIRAYNVQVERDLALELPLLCVDRARLLQAFLNTMRNGAQAMADGGILRISTRWVVQENANDSSEPPIEWIEIQIADSGTGIPERALKQVFDPFFSTKVAGSGLGLPVTRRIIDDHGGKIDVRSREGEGTTFSFRLPALRPSDDGDEASCEDVTAEANP